MLCYAVLCFVVCVGVGVAWDLHIKSYEFVHCHFRIAAISKFILKVFNLNPSQ